MLLSLSTRTEGDRIVPHYLTERDHPWLRAVLDEHARFVGRKRGELRDRMREPLSVRVPRAKLRVVCHLLERLARDRVAFTVAPREARWAVFRAASSGTPSRTTVLARSAASLGVTAEQIEAALFADLAGELRIAPLPDDLGPARLAGEANLAIVGSLLRRASRVRIQAWGETRALVRQARLAGLICLVRRPSDDHPRGPRTAGFDTLGDRGLVDGVRLDISGPFALFRHTEVYGRALAALVPRAAWCTEFEITADCVLGRGSETTTLVVRSGDPIPAGRELSRHDSRLEMHFERDFLRVAPDWDLVREPRPIEVGDALIFPDFELVHRREPRRRWLLEIAGFWTPAYLETKLRRLRQAGLERLVLCVDERRCCSDAELPPEARVVRYRGRIDPGAVLGIIDHLK
jgi:predicted nuclease of restriction endonuclease-like RecB superfamily